MIALVLEGVRPNLRGFCVGDGDRELAPGMYCLDVAFSAPGFVELRRDGASEPIARWTRPGAGWHQLDCGRYWLIGNIGFDFSAVRAPVQAPP